MYKYYLVVVLAIVASVFLNPGYSLSQSAESEVNTLKGLQGVGVAVEDIDAEAVTDGLDKAKLLAAVTQKLKKAKIKVYTDMELPTVSGQPTLVVNINTVKHPGPIYIFTAALDFNQIVILKRNKGLTAVSPTWSVLTTGGSVPEDLIDKVQSFIDPMVDSFIADYKRANPK